MEAAAISGLFFEVGLYISGLLGLLTIFTDSKELLAGLRLIVALFFDLTFIDEFENYNFDFNCLKFFLSLTILLIFLSILYAVATL
jgi:hypothetical protein